MLARDVAQAEAAPAQARRKRAARDLPDLLAVAVERIAVAYRGASLHLEAHQLSLHALRLDPRQRLLADEILAELHHPFETGLQRVGLSIHVIAVQQVAGLGPQAFPRRHALRHDAERPAHHQELVPHPRRQVARDPDLVAALAGVAGAADQAGHLAML